MFYGHVKANSILSSSKVCIHTSVLIYRRGVHTKWHAFPTNQLHLPSQLIANLFTVLDVTLYSRRSTKPCHENLSKRAKINNRQIHHSQILSGTYRIGQQLWLWEGDWNRRSWTSLRSKGRRWTILTFKWGCWIAYAIFGVGANACKYGGTTMHGGTQTILSHMGGTRHEKYYPSEQEGGGEHTKMFVILSFFNLLPS